MATATKDYSSIRLDNKYLPKVPEKPLSLQDFDNAGLPVEAFNQYIDIIKQLYGGIFLHAHGGSVNFENDTKLWKKLIMFSMDHGLLPKGYYNDATLKNIRIPSAVSFFRFIYQFDDIPGMLHISSLEEFQLAVESRMIYRNKDIILSSEYKYKMHTVHTSNSSYTAFTYYDKDKKKEVDVPRNDLIYIMNSLKKELKEYHAKSEKNRQHFLTFSKKAATYHNAVIFFEKAVVCEKKMDDIKNTIATLKETIDCMPHKDTPDTFIGDTLWVYKDYILCEKNHHNVVDAKAILHDSKGKEIELTVKYCLDCKQFFIESKIYNHYRQKYGAILGSIRFAAGGKFKGPAINNLNEESPLHLCGYTVNQKDDLSAETRQLIITYCIESGVMTKNEVKSFLTWLIKKNEHKTNFGSALHKWHEDLDFVLSYQTKIQHGGYINHIQKYRPNMFHIKYTPTTVVRDNKSSNSSKATVKHVNFGTAGKNIAGSVVKITDTANDFSNFLNKRVFHIEYEEGTVKKVDGDKALIQFDKFDKVKAVSLNVLVNQGFIELM